MLTSSETAQVLSANFPELTPALRSTRGRSGFYSQLDGFAVLTRRAIDEFQLTRLRQCFTVADALLQRADAYLAAAIETIYLQSLHLDDSPAGHDLARRLMPVRLYRAYEHQRADILGLQ
jgi:hypothetical protein